MNVNNNFNSVNLNKCNENVNIYESCSVFYHNIVLSLQNSKNM